MSVPSNWFTRYKFCQPLGQGGMGTVYLAEDKHENNRRCVIKQLDSKSLDSNEKAEALRVFEREATILRKLDHPGIVRVFDDCILSDGRYYLVMDYIQGCNLELMLKAGGPFKQDLAVQLAIQCCEVLEYLHQQNPPIIYRDLKPSNLMITPEGRVIFVDFGIARFLTPKQTITRVITAGYSPPEQYSGKPDTRSDLYALGITLYQLLTGQHPRPMAPCKTSSVNPPLHPGLADLIQALTAHNPDQRPPDANIVRLKLYEIYKDFYPDFEIPPEIETINPKLSYGKSASRASWLERLQENGIFSSQQTSLSTKIWNQLRRLFKKQEARL